MKISLASFMSVFVMLFSITPLAFSSDFEIGGNNVQYGYRTNVYAKNFLSLEIAKSGVLITDTSANSQEAALAQDLLGYLNQHLKNASFRIFQKTPKSVLVSTGLRSAPTAAQLEALRIEIMDTLKVRALELGVSEAKSIKM